MVDVKILSQAFSIFAESSRMCDSHEGRQCSFYWPILVAFPELIVSIALVVDINRFAWRQATAAHGGW